MTNTTPGPYYVDAFGKVFGQPNGVDSGYVCNPPLIADARMIVQALNSNAELLAALQETVTYLQCCVDEGSNDDSVYLLAQARAAIAKARG